MILVKPVNILERNVMISYLGLYVMKMYSEKKAV